MPQSACVHETVEGLLRALAMLSEAAMARRATRERPMAMVP